MMSLSSNQIIGIEHDFETYLISTRNTYFVIYILSVLPKHSCHNHTKKKLIKIKIKNQNMKNKNCLDR